MAPFDRYTWHGLTDIARSVKYEKIYLNPPKDGTDLYLKVAEYMQYYNHERRHEGIDDEIPVNIYRQGNRKSLAA